MQIAKTSNTDIVTNVKQQVTFGLDDQSTSTIIDMFTKLYEDPEMAFSRETYSNAYDAHTAAGTEDIPFDLHIPSELEPWIEIRDYGTGCSDEFMNNGYTRVGHSTKRGADDQIGGFGVGRLTFLLVTDQAAITSYYNGMKTMYTVNRNSKGELTLATQFSVETDEPNGLCLKFPVAPNRIRAFVNVTEQYFKRVTGPRPNFTGGEVDVTPIVYTHQTPLWAAREEVGGWNRDQTIYAIMGNIAYPISPRILTNDDAFNEVSDCLTGSIDLFFNIGEVLPTPSRESLDMCEHTRTALLERLKLLRTELVETVKERVLAADNVVLAKVAYKEAIGSMSTGLGRVVAMKGITYNGVAVNDSVVRVPSPVTTLTSPTDKLDNDGNTIMKKRNTLDVCFYPRETTHRSSSTIWRKSQNQANVDCTQFDKRVYILNDVKKGIRPTIDYNYDIEHLPVLVQALGSDVGFKKLTTALLDLGLSKDRIVLASELMDIPKGERNTETRSKEKVSYIKKRELCADKNTRWTLRNHKSICDASDTAVYINTFSCDIVDEDWQAYLTYLRLAESGIVKRRKIYLVNKTQKRLVPDSWTHVSDFNSLYNEAYTNYRNWMRKYLVITHRYKYLNKTVKDWTTQINPASRYIRGDWRTIHSVSEYKPLIDLDIGVNKQTISDLVFLRDKYEVLMKQFSGLDRYVDLNAYGSSNKLDTLCTDLQFVRAEIMHAARPKGTAFTALKKMVSSQLYLAFSGKDFSPEKLINELQKKGN